MAFSAKKKIRAWLVCGLLLVPVCAGAQLSPKASGLYAAFGLGFVDVEKGTGIGIPLGFTAYTESLRLLATANLLDVGIFQGTRADREYFRILDSFGRSICVDGSGRRVSDLRCSGDADAITSFGADLSFVPVETVFFGGQPSKLFLGAGVRWKNPKTVYATGGLYFIADQRATGVKLSMGKDYVFLGVTWGLNLNRFFGRRP